MLVPQTIALRDRILAAAFVGCAVGLGWGIRGDFGHWLGAAYPGACLGLAFAYVSGQKAFFRWMPILGALTGIFISTGGEMSYGMLHGYAKNTEFWNYTYGFGTLFLQGGAWGTFGGCALGLLMQKERPPVAMWFYGICVACTSGLLAMYVIVDGLGFHMNPGRSDSVVGYAFGVIALMIWLKVRGYKLGLRGAILGFIAFGLGMSLGRLLGNWSYHLSFETNHWNIMEISCGLIGGFVFTFGMLGVKAEAPLEDRGFRKATRFGAAYVMAIIPVAHFLLRIVIEGKQNRWAETPHLLQYKNPEGIATATFVSMVLICLLAIAGTFIWLYHHKKEQSRFAWFPVMFFSLLMLVFQNLSSLHFFESHRENFFDTHGAFWILYALMAAYVIYRQFLARRELVESEEIFARFDWRKWTAFAVLAFILIVALAGLINNEDTAKSSRTRFPDDSTLAPG
ncbi:MAG: hypothetical protein NUW37_14660 [Planctomycetes bacterium]|nr:hypothetical protein [Planctomycetota bacterium]